MPKKKVSASTDVRSPAAALIAKAEAAAGTSVPAPSDEAIAELGKILEHNDARGVGGRGRVNAQAAIVMLRGMGWTGAGETALNALCRVKFGRRTYGTP